MIKFSKLARLNSFRKGLNPYNPWEQFVTMNAILLWQTEKITKKSEKSGHNSILSVASTPAALR
jgi:hypothetical protein